MGQGWPGRWRYVVCPPTVVQRWPWVYLVMRACGGHRDEPAIMAWSLANEPRCQGDFSGATLQVPPLPVRHPGCPRHHCSRLFPTSQCRGSASYAATCG